MNITITPTEQTGISRRLQISVPVETVASYEDRAAKKYAARANLPGFRIGKAPQAMVRKRYADAIRQEAIDLIVNEAFKEAVEREQLKLASQPHVHDLKAAPGQALEFELHCELRPELALTRLDGLTIVRRAATVTDESVDEQLEKLRDQKGDWQPVEERPAPGDMVTVLLATADGAGTIPEGREYRLVLGGGQALPAIEELIMEAEPGASVERAVRWPDDFPDETQRGSTKNVRVQLTDVKRKALPALNDDFAREVGDFDTLEALRVAVREDLSAHASREADADVRRQLLERIVEANPFDVPRSWVNQLIESYQQMYKVPDTEQQRFAEEFRPMAEGQVRRDLIVEAIAQRESLAATAADVDTRVEAMATARNADPGQVYAQLQKAGRLQEIERELTEERVFAWLLERNSVSA